MSNKNTNKEQIEAVNTEATATEVEATETVKGGFKEFKAKAVKGLKEHKKAVLGVTAAVGVAIGAGLLGMDYGKKKGLQDNHQEYIEGEFTEELDYEPTEEETVQTEEAEVEE
ncbi:hypothetical protein LaP1706_gp38 [Lactococcus phage 1706]|uniref:Uncharacterized protein n=1 Tax=Lactococcus phage 1706 TaxID=475178 RepID=B2BTK2_9CAUD|nr:hypothetical protein LaP1706_gp38 [Lactococcus phage 1706]ABV91245.1 unknown [Lactococcus phage 1706]